MVYYVYDGLNLVEEPSLTADGIYDYQKVFPDPADERLFRAARLIREWRGGESPTDDEFKLYLMQD